MSNRQELNALIVPGVPFVNLLPLTEVDHANQACVVGNKESFRTSNRFNRSPLFYDDQRINLQFNGLCGHYKNCIHAERISFEEVFHDAPTVKYLPRIEKFSFDDIQKEHRRKRNRSYTPDENYRTDSMTYEVVYVNGIYMPDRGPECTLSHDDVMFDRLRRAEYVCGMSVRDFIDNVYEFIQTCATAELTDDIQKDIKNSDHLRTPWHLFLYVGAGHVKQLDNDFMINDLPPSMIKDLIMTTKVGVFNEGVVLDGTITIGDISLIQHRLWWRMIYANLEEWNRNVHDFTFVKLRPVYEKLIETYDGRNGGKVYIPNIDIFSQIDSLKFGIGAINLNVHNYPDTSPKGFRYYEEERKSLISIRVRDGNGVQHDGILSNARPRGFPGMQMVNRTYVENERDSVERSFWFMPENKRCFGAVRERFEEKEFTVQMLINSILEQSGLVCRKPAILIYIGGDFHAELDNNLQLLEIFSFMLSDMVIVEDIDTVRQKWGERLLYDRLCTGQRVYFNHRLFWHILDTKKDEIHTEEQYQVEMRTMRGIIKHQAKRMEDMRTQYVRIADIERTKEANRIAHITQLDADRLLRNETLKKQELDDAIQGTQHADETLGWAAFHAQAQE